MQYIILFTVLISTGLGFATSLLNIWLTKTIKIKVMEYYTRYYGLLFAILFYQIVSYFNFGMFGVSLDFYYERVNYTIVNIYLIIMLLLLLKLFGKFYEIVIKTLVKIGIWYLVANILFCILAQMNFINLRFGLHSMIMLSYFTGYLIIIVHLFFIYKFYKKRASLDKIKHKIGLEVCVISILFLPVFCLDVYYQMFQGIRSYIPNGFPLSIIVFVILSIRNIVLGIKYLTKPETKVLQEEKTTVTFYQQYKITEREREIIEYIKSGKTNQEIADELFISLSTIKKHISNIFEKTGVKNRIELINIEKT